jgi:hypothetical protein
MVLIFEKLQLSINGSTSDSMGYFVFHFNTTYVVESKIVKQSLNMRPLASEEKDCHVPCMLPVVM